MSDKVQDNITRVEEWLGEWKKLDGADPENIYGVNGIKLDPLDLEIVLLTAQGQLAASTLDETTYDRVQTIFENWRGRVARQISSMDRLLSRRNTALRTLKAADLADSGPSLGRTITQAIKDLEGKE